MYFDCLDAVAHGGNPQDRAASLRINSSKSVLKYTIIFRIILPISRFSRLPIPDSRFPIPDSRPKCKKPTPVRSGDRGNQKDLSKNRFNGSLLISLT
ncbi:MAG: hypothetical protein F6K50_08050 [Moorea sp. SIO3I7]|nr:hypothetical protein [Moorena sp. SIO3I7]